MNFGRHILVDLYGCNPTTLNDVQRLKQILQESARRAKCTIVGELFHQFAPQGTSGVVVIAESHLSIHTWPEEQYASADLFTCGDETDPWAAYEYLRAGLEATDADYQEIKRGHRLRARAVMVSDQAQPITGHLAVAE